MKHPGSTRRTGTIYQIHVIIYLLSRDCICNCTLLRRFLVWVVGAGCKGRPESGVCIKHRYICIVEVSCSWTLSRENKIVTSTFVSFPALLYDSFKPSWHSPDTHLLTWQLFLKFNWLLLYLCVSSGSCMIVGYEPFVFLKSWFCLFWRWPAKFLNVIF